MILIYGTNYWAIGKQVKISDEDWDKIGDAYRPYSRKLSQTYMPFSKFLRGIIKEQEDKAKKRR
jgi:hypothetical protein